MAAIRIVTLALLAAASSLAPSLAQARTLDVGADKEFKQPSAAIAAAHPGDIVSIQPGEYFDCAMVHTGNLIIQGVGDPAKVLLTDKACAGKGILVIDGDKDTIRNLTLTRARVPDGNGAGIRNEATNLTVDHVQFVNNQNGILSTPQQAGTLTITNSLFDRNGYCGNSGGCAHGLYISTAALVHIENTAFIGTKQGHHIKSRAARLEIIGTSIKDGPDGTASYEIEAANGGALVVRNCTIEKGPQADNHGTIIAVGTEGVTQPTPEITIDNNTVRNDGDFNTIFVRNLTATEALLRGNKISGSVKPLDGDGKVVAGS